MADNQKGEAAQDSQAAEEAATAQEVPFPKIISKLMTWCGCRPGQMRAMMAACFPPEKKEGETTTDWS